MKKLQLLPIDSPLVEVECGGGKQRSQHIKHAKKNPNFPQSVIFFDVVSFSWHLGIRACSCLLYSASFRGVHAISLLVNCDSIYLNWHKNNMQKASLIPSPISSVTVLHALNHVYHAVESSLQFFSLPVRIIPYGQKFSTDPIFSWFCG